MFFMRFVLAEMAVLVGFFLFFLGGYHLATYMVGLVLGMVGLLSLAPTKKSIDSWDRARSPLEPRPSLGALFTQEE